MEVVGRTNQSKGLLAAVVEGVETEAAAEAEEEAETEAEEEAETATAIVVVVVVVVVEGCPDSVAEEGHHLTPVK